MLKIPALRRSKEPADEKEQLLVSPRGSTTPRGTIASPRGRTTTPRGGGEGLAKWELKLVAEGGSPTTNDAPATTITPQASPRTLVSPRWVDDKAEPRIQKHRTDAQLGAMAALYATNPAAFD